MDVHTDSFLKSEAHLMCNTADSGRDISTISDFDMEVDNETAVLISAYDNTSAFEELAIGDRGNSGAEGADIADIGNAEAVADGMADDFSQIVFRNGNFTNMVFKCDHDDTLLCKRIGTATSCTQIIIA